MTKGTAAPSFGLDAADDEQKGPTQRGAVERPGSSSGTSSLDGSAAVLFVIPTGISCHAALDKAAYAPFRKEGHMNCNNATKSNRKSGGAERRNLQFYQPVLEMFFDLTKHYGSAKAT